MKKKYTIKNLKFVNITNTIWWSKGGADFSITKEGKKFLIYDQGFIQGTRLNLQSAKKYCRKLHLKNIKKHLQEVK